MEKLDRLSDKLLVLRYQTGDADALGRLARKYYSPLTYFLRRLLDGPDEAEETLQDVWLTVLRNLHTLRKPTSFRAWLYRIARNAAYDRIRKPPGPTRWNAQADTETAVEDEQLDSLISQADAAAIHRCLDQLSHAHKEVLMLRFFEDMPYDEIAAVVGCKKGTVRSRIHYAKRSLRALMEGKEDV